MESTDKKKGKKFDLSFGQKMGAKQKLKKNYVLVILLRTNGNINIKFLQVQDGMIYLKDNKTFHIATTKHIGYYKKYPVIIQPEWDLEPLSRVSLMEAAEGGKYATAQNVIIDAMERVANKLKAKNKLAGNAVIWILLGGAIVVYLIYSMIIGK